MTFKVDSQSFRPDAAFSTDFAFPIDPDSCREVEEGVLTMHGSEAMNVRSTAEGKSNDVHGGIAGSAESSSFARESIILDGGVLSGGELTQDLEWLSGRIRDFTIGPGGRVIAANSDSAKFWTGEILNKGSIEHGGNLLFFGSGEGGVRFVNEGDYALIGPHGNLYYGYYGGYIGESNLFINNGRIRRSGEGESFILMPFVNNGVVEVETGGLALYGVHSITGTYIAETGSIIFDGGIYTITENAVFEGDNYTLRSGTLTGGEFTQDLEWHYGTIDNLTIGAGGRVIVSSDTDRLFTGEILNKGYVKHSGRGLYYGKIRFVNEGEYGLVGETVGITLWDQSDPSLFINKGRLKRSGGVWSSWISIPFENQGVLEIGAGTTLGHHFNQASGSTLFTDSVSSILYGGQLCFDGGELRGAGQVFGDVISNSSIKPGSGIGRLVINGSLFQLPDGVIDIEIGGRSIGEFDSIRIQGSATLNGSIQISLVNGFKPALDDTFVIADLGGRSGITRYSGLRIDDELSFAVQAQDNGLILKVVRSPDADSDPAVFTITGTLAVGQTLLAVPSADVPDTWGNDLVYLWQASSDGISWTSIGGNSPSYTVARSNAGQQLRVQVVYAEGEGIAESVVTPAVLIPLQNSAPSALNLSTVSMNLDLRWGDVVATLTTTDPDPDNEFVYRLVSGPGDSDNHSFLIYGSQLVLRGAGDITRKRTFNVRLRTTDQGGLSNERAVQLIVNPVSADPLSYLATYPDLITAFGLDSAAATRHYAEYGFHEGRVLDGFDEISYLATYPDLITEFGLDGAAATRHYVQHGFHEGRGLDGFDEISYLATHPDLMMAFGSNGAAATRHYVQYGFHEGRVLDGFDEVSYLANNPDLIAAFGSDGAAATRHYVQYGFHEGRTITSSNDLG